MAEGSISQQGQDGADSGAVRISAVVCRPPWRIRAANDNPAPLHYLVMRGLRLMLLLSTVTAVAWYMAF
ncbi:MAG: hypothetical protein WCF85_16930 [Rhodospirillaceae bacterium]